MHISLRFSFSLLMALGSLVIVNSDDRSSRSPSTCTFEDIFVSRSGYEVNIFNAQRCKIIDLSGENIGELGIAELSKCSLAHLEIFDLTRNKLGENGGSYLSTILKNVQADFIGRMGKLFKPSRCHTYHKSSEYVGTDTSLHGRKTTFRIRGLKC